MEQKRKKKQRKCKHKTGGSGETLKGTKEMQSRIRSVVKTLKG